MGNKDKWVIPVVIMRDAASRAQREFKKTIENMTQYELEKLKEWLGAAFAHIPLDDVRRQATNLRKRGALGAISGHGPSKSSEPPPEMKEYYRTEHWRQFAERVREFWGFTCAICNSCARLDVHHRNYDRLYCEELTDCIALCRKCHKVADVRRRREAGRNLPLFPR